MSEAKKGFEEQSQTASKVKPIDEELIESSPNVCNPGNEWPNREGSQAERPKSTVKNNWCSGQ